MVIERFRAVEVVLGLEDLGSDRVCADVTCPRCRASTSINSCEILRSHGTQAHIIVQYVWWCEECADMTEDEEDAEVMETFRIDYSISPIGSSQPDADTGDRAVWTGAADAGVDLDVAAFRVGMTNILEAARDSNLRVFILAYLYNWTTELSAPAIVRAARSWLSDSVNTHMIPNTLRDLEEAGFVERDGTTWSITHAGKCALRALCPSLFKEEK